MLHAQLDRLLRAGSPGGGLDYIGVPDVQPHILHQEPAEQVLRRHAWRLWRCRQDPAEGATSPILPHRYQLTVPIGVHIRAGGGAIRLHILFSHIQPPPLLGTLLLLRLHMRASGFVVQPNQHHPVLPERA